MAKAKQTVKIFKVWMELDNNKAFSVLVPAKNEKEAKEECAGNGEIIAIKEVTCAMTEKLKNALSSLTTEEHQEAHDILYKLVQNQMNFILE